MTDNDPDGDKLIYELSKLTEVAYQRRRKGAARELGMRVDVLDKLIRQARAQAEEDATALPHWNPEPWDSEVNGAQLLDDIEGVLRHYIVMPKGAGEALALWTLHAWTKDAGEISPFLVLVSPTKRCGKTSVLIVLLYLTPRSELASNISSSALFRYIEEVRPTLLIDEADSFVKDNEEMRGVLNSGHAKAAAYVIRNVEVNGEHKPNGSRPGRRRPSPRFGRWRTRLRTAPSSSRSSASRRWPRSSGCVGATATGLQYCAGRLPAGQPTTSTS